MDKVFTSKRLSTAEAVAPLIVTWLASCWALFAPRFSFYSVILASVLLMMSWIIAIVLRHSPYGSAPGLRVGTVLFAVILFALLYLYPHSGFRVLFIYFMPSVFMIVVWMLVLSLYCFWPPLMSPGHQGLFVYMLIVLAGLATVACIWSTGYTAIALQHPAPERFPYTFEIWDRLHFSAHGFFLFDMRWQQFESKSFYDGYSQLFAFLHYLALKIVKAFSGISYARGIRLTPFIYGLVFSFLFPLFSLMWTSAKQRKSFSVILILVLSTVLFVSIPDMWTGMGRYDADNAFPLYALFHIGIVSLLWGCWQIPIRWIIIWILIYASMLPLEAVLSAFVIVLCSIAGKRRAKNLAIAAIALMAFGAISYCAPVLVGKVLGLSVKGSSVMLRSGLDGVDVNFYNVYQAVFAPMAQIELRPYSLFGVAWYVLAILLWVTKWYSENQGIGFTAVCAMTGIYFINAILFPQSVSVHPYLYDIILVLPIFAAIPVVLSYDPLHNPNMKVLVPLFLLGALGIVQHNITMIMRFVGKHFLT